MACSRFLNFRPTNYPRWRNVDKSYSSLPSVSEMIKDIAKYHLLWLEEKEKMSKDGFSKFKKQMFLDFLYYVQQGEDIGVSNSATFENICQEELEQTKNKGMKRSLEEHDEDESEKSQKRHHSNDLEATDKGKNPRDESSYENDNQSLPNSLELSDFLGEDEFTKEVVETRNLLKGYQFLNDLVKDFRAGEPNSNYLQLLDVESCINDCHKILMKELIPTNQTQPGIFSTLPRTAEFEGTTHHYPSYKTTEIAFDAINSMITQYNLMVQEISNEMDREKKIELSLKCASVLLFGFLGLHPFSDGNGRLARLLCNHCLRGFCPFPTAIYNMYSRSTRDDYIKALIEGRKYIKSSDDQYQYSNDAIFMAMQILEQKPADLCSLVIESNWFTWRQFHLKLGTALDLNPFEKVSLKREGCVRVKEVSLC